MDKYDSIMITQNTLTFIIHKNTAHPVATSDRVHMNQGLGAPNISVSDHKMGICFLLAQI